MLTVVALVSAAYLAIASLGLDARKSTFGITVAMTQTAGLMDTSPVSMYGMRIGRVTEISVQRDEVHVRVEVDAAQQVPRDAIVVVQNLSPAGEQFLDFRPTRSAGPYLGDGDTVPRSRVADTATVGELLGKVDRLGEMLDPAIVDRLSALLVNGMPDEATIKNLSSIVGYMGATAKDKTDGIRSMFRVAQELDRRLMAINAPEALAPVGRTMRTLTPAMKRVLAGIDGYAAMSRRSDAWDGKVGPFMDRLLSQLNLLLPALGPIAAALTPVSDQLRGIRVNAGAFTDFWGRAFPPGGPMRVQLKVN
ncbi:MlaD family protein [Gordonia araii]|uniref:MlaD family protein n=1 Tax=Gordonia araii TaxID=263909 RepID=UPI001FDEBDCF|nr:MlaD family protein [Gordonia araii]